MLHVGTNNTVADLPENKFNNFLPLRNDSGTI